MPKYEAQELREKRAGLWEQMKDVNDKAEAESRDLTAEEAEQFDRLETEFDSLEKRIARVEKVEGIAPLMTRKPGEDIEERRLEHGDDGSEKLPETLQEFNEQRQGVLPQDTPEYRQAFFKMITAVDPSEISSEEYRVLSKASAGAGLNLVPTSFSRQLVQSLRNFGHMRDLANVITTQSGEALQVPTVSSHGTASWTAENAGFTASDEAFGRSTLNAYKAATLIKISEELLQDSAFDLESYIVNEFGQRIGVLENTGYVTGDGSGKPTGVTTNASAGVTAASATAITANELIDLFHSLSPPYRRNAVWLLNDSTIKLIRKLVDSYGQYLWQPGLQAGAPDMLFGKAVYADPDMAAAATGNVSALFGDFSYYWIRDASGIAFQRLNELYAENGQVGFRAYHRTDGLLLNTAAVKKLTQA